MVKKDYLLLGIMISAVLIAIFIVNNYKQMGIEPASTTTTLLPFTEEYCHKFRHDNCPSQCEVGSSCPMCLDIGCHAKDAHRAKETTTLPGGEEKETDQTESTTTLAAKYDCRITRFRIKSYGYKAGNLTVYFQNVGSSWIYNYDLTMHKGSEQEVKSFYNLTVEPRETERFDIFGMGKNVTNITVSVPGCDLSHTIEVHEVN